MTRAVLALLVLSGFALAQPAPADRARLPAESDQTRKRLAEAEQKLLGGKAVDAADDLQKILDEAGDDLVSVDGKHFIPARRLAQRFLAKLPPEVLRTYRDRVDEPARKLLDAAKRDRDPRPLHALLAKYFPARPAEDALLLLGELHFERGDFREAEACWRRLLPESPLESVPFPDPRKASRAGVLARIVLAGIFQGERAAASRDLAVLAKEFPDAKGRLAGKDGTFAETLTALLASPPGVPPEPTPDGDWTAFAGSATRSGKVTGRLPYYWPTRPTWKTPIPMDKANPRNPTPSAKSVGFHPVVLNGIAYISDGVRVLSFDPLTGKSDVAFDLRKRFNTVAPDPPPLPLAVDADFTLTVADGKLFARLGEPTLVGDPTQSYLVALAPEAGKLTQKWRLVPPVSKGTIAGWEGSPVVVGGRVYAAFAKFEGTRTAHAIACFDDPPGKPVWVADVSDAPNAAIAENRTRHELLAFAGGNLILCPNAGVIAAVDAASGKPAWGFRYPPSDRTPATTGPRDVCPPVSADGRVFIAPTDSDRVYALDATTGKPLWEAGPTQTDQLLGVTRGRLIATVAGPNRGIRGLDVRTGSHAEPDGWATHDDPFLGSFGRGLVSDELVLWPTKSGLFLLNPTDGTNARPPIPGPHGNLAFADGVLLVATPTAVWGYVADRRLLQERKRAAVERPGDADAAAKLGLALADAGRFADAEATGAEELTRRQAEWLSDAAERALLRGNRAEAKAALRDVVRGAFPEPVRARAAGRLLTLDPAAEIPLELRDSWVLAPNGLPTRVRELRTDASPPVDAIAFPPAPPPDLTTLPALGYDAKIEHETRFPNPRCVPLLPFAGEADLPGLGRRVPAEGRKLVVTDGEKLLAFRPGEDKPAWESPLPAGVRPTHGIAAGDALLVAGPRGIGAFRLRDGTPHWHVLVPDTDPLPAGEGRPVPRSAGLPPAVPELSGFAVDGDRLVARLGPHHLIGLDLRTGRAAWVLDAGGRKRYVPFAADPEPRFSPGFALVGNRVVAKTSTGRRIEVVASSGTLRRESVDLLAPWDTSPAAFAGHVIAADGPGTVRAFAPDLRAAEWTYLAGGDTSLAGRSPAVRLFGEMLVAAIVRNHGIEIAKLHPANGRPAWGDRTAFLPVSDIDLSLADSDGSNLYLPAEGRLTAVRLEDGRAAWTTDLGPGTWRVRAGRKAVIAYPAEPVPEETCAEVFPRVLRRSRLNAADIPRLTLGAYDAWADRAMPVLFLDAETGRVKHRFSVPCGPVSGVHLGGDVSVIVSNGKGYWLK